METIIKNPKLYAVFIRGPPDNGYHTLNKGKVREWINAQVTKQRRDAAAKIMDAVRYVPYSEFLTETKLFIDKNLELLSRPRAVISGALDRSTKSNYWMSVMISSILWQEHQVYLPVIPDRNRVIESGKYDHILDIDDCGYTGNQTGCSIMELARFIYEHITGYTPKWGVEERREQLTVIDGSVVKYYVCRIFASSAAIDQWEDMVLKSDGQASKCITFLIGQIYDSLETQLGSETYKIMAHAISPWVDIGGNPTKTAIYFDHKLADSVSTLQVPLMFGTVFPYTLPSPGSGVYPFGADYLDNRYFPLPKEDAPDRPNPEQAYNIGSLINRCENPLYKGLTFEEVWEYAEERPRCPVAWYKHIDYDAATLNLPESKSLFDIVLSSIAKLF